MRLLSLLWQRSRLLLCLAVLGGLLSGAASAGLLALINQVLSGHREPWLLPGFIGMCVLALVSRLGSQMLLNHLHERMVYELRVDLFHQLLATPLRRLEELGPHRLLAILADDVMVTSTGLLILPTVISHLAVILGCLAYMAWLSWPALLGCLVFMFLGVLSYLLPTRYVTRLIRATRDVQDVLFKNFRALTDGIKELKQHRERREAFLAEDLVRTAAELRRLRTHSSYLDSATRIWGSLLFFVMVGLLLFLLPRFLTVELPALMGFTLTVLYLQQPLDTLLNTTHTLKQSNVALERITHLGLEEREAPRLADSTAHPVRTFQELELDGITHTYHSEQEDRAFTLGPLHLTLRRGEIIFLVGGNGSGKTTLAKLITGLYLPESGELRLNGVPVTQQNREDYRQHFSTIFSDFYLFDRLVGLAPPDLSERVREYLRRLQLDRKVRLEQGVLSTTALSQGQRKRLALLTAWLEDRPFYVFDEWAADQDPTFKHVFYEELLPELKRRGKTLLVISHDDRYFHLADRLIRLESGQLREAPPLQAHPRERELA